MGDISFNIPDQSCPNRFELQVKSLFLNELKVLRDFENKISDYGVK